MSQPLERSAQTLAVALVIVIAAWSAAPRAMPQNAELVPVPGVSDLLRVAPFDRITLIDGTVLVVEPVSPRPLPVIDPKDKDKDGKGRARAKKSTGPEEQNFVVGVLPGAPKDVDPEGVAADEVKLHLLQASPNEVRDFKIKRPNMTKIEYFEDLLLEECDRLVMAHDYGRAFECCLRVYLRNAGWPGLDDHVNHVLYSEGSRALLDGDAERGLRLLRELLGRKRDYPGLLDQIGAAYTKRIERALKLGLYAQGRRVLHELAELAPEHVLVREMRALYITKAQRVIQDTEQLHGPERLDGLTLALEIWPELPGVELLYEKAFAADTTLDVAVTDVPFPLGPWSFSSADARISRLLYRPILARDDDASRQGKVPGQLAAAVESSDLGRRLLIRIRSGVFWSDGSRPVSAIDDARDLIDRTDPHSPRFEARWADLLDRVETTDESRVELRFNRAPLRTGLWLMSPMGPAHGSIDGRVATTSQERPLVSNAAYHCFMASGERIELRLRDAQESTHARAQRAGGAPLTPMPRIRRIREVRLSAAESAVVALKRGAVSLIEHVPPDQVNDLTAPGELKVGRYTNPLVHVIALDGRNPALRNRALRRALSYAIDRKVLLEDHVLKHRLTPEDTVADGPFPKGSYADAPAVKPLEAHPWLARMLVAAARKELGGLPIKLKLEYPAIPEVQRIVDRIIGSFRAAGVEITPIEALPARLESELRTGRRFDLAYRVLRTTEPVFDAGPLLCPGYDAPPEANALASGASPRIVQLLLQLERAAEWVTARGLALQIDRESRDELPVIPLWQLSDHYAWRDRLSGPSSTAAELYQGIETWEIKPWIAKDPWKAP
jgi:peptide/nickel transport system substrate-binding protein